MKLHKYEVWSGDEKKLKKFASNYKAEVKEIKNKGEIIGFSFIAEAESPLEFLVAGFSCSRQ
jgi:hypothetical protein